MCQTCKRFKKFIRQDIPEFLKKSVEVLYDLSAKKRADQFVALSMALAGWYFNRSALVPAVCAGLFFCWWSVLKDGHVGEIHKERMVIPLLAMGVFLWWACPIIQNRIDPPKLTAHAPQNRSDAKHIIVRIENTGESDLPKKETIIRLGLLSLKDGKSTWIEPNRLAQIQQNRQVAFRFQRPDSVPDFSVVLVQSQKLASGYLLEPFYLFRNNNGDFVWGSYYENIGLVDDNDAEAMDKVLESLDTCLDSHKWDGRYLECLTN